MIKKDGGRQTHVNLTQLNVVSGQKETENPKGSLAFNLTIHSLYLLNDVTVIALKCLEKKKKKKSYV